LNASYAADGYARVKEQGLGVLLTTYVFDDFPMIDIVQCLSVSASENCQL